MNVLERVAEAEPLGATVESWLAQFEQALSKADDAALHDLFHAESYWRDVLALTWTIQTVGGSGAVAEALASTRAFKPSGFALDRARTSPRVTTRAGTQSTEAFFKFETAIGRCNGVVRLVGAKAWTVMTALNELKGHEERTGKRRPTGQSHSRDFRGPNWLDQRKSAATYQDHDPVVLVVGGGHAGLSIAARLTQLGIDTLIVDRESRIGDNWRNRYHALTLHNQVQVNHLPYMPFPPNWPTYIPKDKLAGWFEAYVECLELNYWTGTELVGGAYDEEDQRWAVTLRREGASQTMRPRHIVLATGVSGIPNIPDIPSLKDFSGQVLHSSQYRDGEDWSGKRAIVIGTGNSGHDIAQDLYSSGAQVTLVQRSPTLIVNIEPSAQLAYTLYDEGPPLDDCDLLAASMPTALVRKSHQTLTEQGRKLDKPLLDRLEQRGFKLDWGEDGTGWQFLYLTRGGGYYFNVGCSNLVAEGKVALAQFSDIDRFVGGRRTRARRLTDCGRPRCARDRLQGPGAPRAQAVWRRNRVACRPDLGVRQRSGIAQHVRTHAAAGLMVHRRQPCAVPHLLEISRPAGQGDRGRPAGEAGLGRYSIKHDVRSSPKRTFRAAVGISADGRCR